MESTLAIIERVLGVKNIAPVTALQHLIQCLGFTHQMIGMNVGKPGATVSIATEFEYFKKFAGRQGEDPASILDALEMAVRSKYNVDALNLQIAKKEGNTSGVAALTPQVELGTAVLLMLRECMNRFEHGGLSHGVRAEAMIKGMMAEFVGGCLDGEKRVITSGNYKVGDEVKIADRSDPQWIDVYEMREGRKCHFIRREAKSPPS